MITADMIMAKFSNHLEFHSGPLTNSFTHICSVQSANNQSLCFISNNDYLQDAMQKNIPILICSTKLTLGQLPNHITFFKTKNLDLAKALLMQEYSDNKKARFNYGPSAIHPTAYVSQSAQLGRDVVIGPQTFIGDNVQIGEKTIVGAGTIIESDAKIGVLSILHPHVFVGTRCEIGSNCEIHPHTTIGSDGYAYAHDQYNNHHKIPQIGNVVIENNVEIGANCAIDRAAYDSTRIGEGTKIDNLCHIAHNCDIGKRCIITAAFFIAGSSKIGDNFLCGGHTCVSDHMRIASNVIIGGGSVVTRHIEESGAYAGYPIQPMKDALKTLSSLPLLPEMRKNLSRLLKKENKDEN